MPLHFACSFETLIGERARRMKRRNLHSDSPNHNSYAVASEKIICLEWRCLQFIVSNIMTLTRVEIAFFALSERINWYRRTAEHMMEGNERMQQDGLEDRTKTRQKAGVRDPSLGIMQEVGKCKFWSSCLLCFCMRKGKATEDQEVFRRKWKGRRKNLDWSSIQITFIEEKLFKA